MVPVRIASFRTALNPSGPLTISSQIIRISPGRCDVVGDRTARQQNDNRTSAANIIDLGDSTSKESHEVRIGRLVLCAFRIGNAHPQIHCRPLSLSESESRTSSEIIPTGRTLDPTPTAQLPVLHPPSAHHLLGSAHPPSRSTIDPASVDSCIIGQGASFRFGFRKTGTRGLMRYFGLNSLS
jgi:hypothetical protein